MTLWVSVPHCPTMTLSPHMHGRCHPKSEAKRLAQESAVESALKAIREAAQTNKVHGLDLKQPFVRFDRNNSGSLDRNELERGGQGPWTSDGPFSF